MSGTLRSAAEKRQYAHRPRPDLDDTCECCNMVPCPDRMFADFVIKVLDSHREPGLYSRSFAMIPDPLNR